MFKLMQLIALLCFCTSANAVLCKTTTSDGQQAFLFRPDAKTGIVTPTKTLSGTVATMVACKVTEVKVVKEVFETYVVPNPVNSCEKEAVLACDPDFKGLPIGDLSNYNKYCGFVFITTKSVENVDGVVRYLNGQPYSGYQSINAVQSCKQPLLIKQGIKK